MKKTDVQELINQLGPRSGRIHLPAESFQLPDTVRIDRPCVCLEGELWAYSSDPNGVFESRYGTQLKLKGKSFPA